MKQTRSTKPNPRSVPRTQADVDRAYAKGTTDGCNLAMAIFLTVIVDKFGGHDWVPDIWEHCSKLSAEIKEHRVNLFDLVNVLEEEYGIEFK